MFKTILGFILITLVSCTAIADTYPYGGAYNVNIASSPARVKISRIGDVSIGYRNDIDKVWNTDYQICISTYSCPFGTYGTFILDAGESVGWNYSGSVYAVSNATFTIRKGLAILKESK